MLVDEARTKAMASGGGWGVQEASTEPNMSLEIKLNKHT
jgi:hypothetical protein